MPATEAWRQVAALLRVGDRRRLLTEFSERRAQALEHFHRHTRETFSIWSVAALKGRPTRIGPKGPSGLPSRAPAINGRERTSYCFPALTGCAAPSETSPPAPLPAGREE